MVLRPVIEGRRYDLVFDIDHRLFRVQCKWARASRRGVLVVNSTACRYTPHGYVRTTYDAHARSTRVAAYCQELKRCYWLPIEVVAGHAGDLASADARRQQPADRDKLRC